MAKEELAKLVSEDKGTRPKVLLLITDGSQSLGDAIINPVTVANEIRSAGVHVFAIGTGTSVKAKELQAIAGSQENVYLTSHYSQLHSNKFVEKLSDVACKAGLFKAASVNIVIFYTVALPLNFPICHYYVTISSLLCFRCRSTGLNCD